MNPENAYHYSAITEPGIFRLILLKPSDDLEAGIECSIIESALEKWEDDIVEHYTALSYTWGDVNNRCTVAVDGKSLDTTASLECALRHIRDKNRVLRVWADGICINQNDVPDRNLQVRQMASIYQSAQHTIIFLGPSSPDSNFVMQCMLARKQTKSGAIFTASNKDQQFQSLIEKNFLANPWFSRVWTLQELVLSIDPWVQSGRSRIRWKSLCQHVLGDPGTRERERASGMSQIRVIYTSKFLSEEQADPNSAENSQPFFEILKLRRASGVTDPKDMVYGHLGLADPHTQSVLPVDYNKTVCEVYEDIAHYLIQDHGLSILTYVEEINLSERRKDLPSWVPDWTVPYTPGVQGSRRILKKAKNSDQPNYHISFVIPHVLAVAGWHYGFIGMIVDRTFLDAHRTWLPRRPLEDTNSHISEWIMQQTSENDLHPVLIYYRELCEKWLRDITSFSISGLQLSLRNWIDSELPLNLEPVVSRIFSSSFKIQESQDDSIIGKLAIVLYKLLYSLSQTSLSDHKDNFAITNSFEVVEVSSSARVNDAIFIIEGYKENFIFRPEEEDLPMESSIAIEREMKESFTQRNGQQGLLDHHAREIYSVDSVKFVTHVPEPPYRYSVLFPEFDGLFRISAIH